MFIFGDGRSYLVVSTILFSSHFSCFPTANVLVKRMALCIDNKLVTNKLINQWTKS